ncbi:MAG: hypothetical protein FJ271_33655 [Planctomycetes bacterium]|nr:hypothetical protein [Planctomycetota bacterium]
MRNLTPQEQADIIVSRLIEPASGPIEYLVAGAGQIAGTSTSAELWIGVVLALGMGRDFQTTMGWAAIGATVVVAIRLHVIGVNFRTASMIAVTFAGVLLWSSLGYALRMLWQRFKAA